MASAQHGQPQTALTEGTPAGEHPLGGVAVFNLALTAESAVVEQKRCFDLRSTGA